MKAKHIVIGAFSLSTLLACKIDKKEEVEAVPLPPSTEQVGTGKVTVTVKAIVTKDDSFQIFYTEDGSLNYNGDLSIITAVKGNPAAQDIVFSLSDDALPTTLRLDLGSNKDQGQINIESVVVDYYGKKVNVSGKEFLKYFQPNVNVTVDAQGLVKLKTADDGVYDPMVYPSGDMVNALKGILVK